MRASCLFIAAVLFVGMGAGCAASPPLGLVGSDESLRVTAFDPITLAVQGAVRVRPGGERAVYALALHPTQAEAYVSNRFGRIARLTLAPTAPPRPGPTIYPSHTAADLAVVHTDRVLLVATGVDTASTAGVVSSIDVATGAEIDRLNLGRATPVAVAACDDQTTVLVGTDDPQAVHKLTVGPTGQLTRAAVTFPVQRPLANVHCAPGAQAAVAVSSVGATIQSFAVASMTGVSARDLAARTADPVQPPLGLSGVFAPGGHRFFVRSERGDFTGVGFVEAFDFDATTGALGPVRQRARLAPTATTARGTGAVAISADGSRLYVTEPFNDRVLVLNATTLEPVATLRAPSFNGPFSIVVRGE